MPTVDDYLGFLPAYQAGLQDYRQRQSQELQKQQLGLERERQASLEQERIARAQQEQERAAMLKQQAAQVAAQLAAQEQYKSALKGQVDQLVQKGVPLEEAGPLAFRQTLHLLPAHMLPTTVGSELNRQAVNERFDKGITSKEKIAGEANTVKTDIAASRNDSAEAIANAKAAAALEREQERTTRALEIEKLRRGSAATDQRGRIISEQEYVSRHLEGHRKATGKSTKDSTDELRQIYREEWPQNSQQQPSGSTQPSSSFNIKALEQWRKK